MEAAQGGELPAVGYAVTHVGRVVRAVPLPCGMTALLTPFPVVQVTDMMSLQEASLGGGGARGIPSQRAWTRSGGKLRPW